MGHTDVMFVVEPTDSGRLSFPEPGPRGPAPCCPPPARALELAGDGTELGREKPPACARRKLPATFGTFAFLDLHA